MELWTMRVRIIGGTLSIYTIEGGSLRMGQAALPINEAIHT